MKLVIDGHEYDAAAQPFIGDLRLLKAEFGFGWGTVIERLRGLDADADIGTLLDDDGFLDAFVAWLWMARLRAGERSYTRADAERTPLDAIEWKAEPGDEAPADESVPTSAPAGSARGDAAPKRTAARRSTPSSTKTSRKRSTAA